jgi:hypothetical protein
MPSTTHKLRDGYTISAYWPADSETGPFTMYQDFWPGANKPCEEVRQWNNVDELTMRCIVEALKQDPRAGMEESDG